MKVSVAMCAYNSARFIVPQLESMAAQTVAPDEVIVCDDCSSDETPELIHSFADRLPLRLIANPVNLGIVPNFEKAMRLCSGDLILLADADDIWYQWRVEETLSAFSPDTDLIFGDADLIDEDGQLLGVRLSQRVRLSWRQRDHMFRTLLNHNVATGATMAIRKASLDRALPVDSSWLHDGWLALILSFLGTLTYIQRPLIQYREHLQQQAGLEPATVSGVLARSMSIGHREYQQQFQMFSAARDRLDPLATTPAHSDYLRALREKLSNLEARMNLSRNPLRRLPVILGELASRRYSRYAAGLKSAAKDLLLSH